MKLQDFLSKFKKHKNTALEASMEAAKLHDQEEVVEEINPEDIDASLFTLQVTNDMSSEVINAPRYSYWKSVARTFFGKKLNWVVMVLLAIIILLSYIYPVVTGYDPTIHKNILNAEMKLIPPSFKYLFGTTDLGDSLFQVVWAGARTSLSLALVCSAINMTVGVLVGAVWGYSKKIDKFMIELYNIVSNVPFVLFITVFMYIVGAGFWQLVGAMTVTGWLGIAYFIRTQVIIIRDREYNLASRCLGTPISRMVTRNMLPYLTSVIVTLLSREVPSYISYEVFLTYIGKGIGTSQPSLGRIINEYIAYMQEPSTGYLFWIPVAVSALVTITLYVAGQGLADASDPKTHM